MWLIVLLTNDDFPVLAVVGHLVSHSEFGKGGSSHDVDQNAGNILLVGHLFFVSTMPATVATTENGRRRRGVSYHFIHVKDKLSFLLSPAEYTRLEMEEKVRKLESRCR